MLLKLLTESVRLALKTARHCIAYSLPSLLSLAAGLQLFQTNAAAWQWLGCFAAFLFFNAMFVYALCDEMLRGAGGGIRMARALTWQGRHLDFFLFVGLALLASALLALYCFDAVTYMFARAEALRDEQAQMALAAGGHTVESGSVGLQASGVSFGAYVALLAALALWSFFCRAGIRIPAHVEGYFMRSEEALDLTRGARFSITAASLLMVAGVTAFADILALELAGLPGGGGVVAGGAAYFLLLTLHVALWTCLYFALVKSSGYYSGRGGAI